MLLMSISMLSQTKPTNAYKFSKEFKEHLANEYPFTNEVFTKLEDTEWGEYKGYHFEDLHPETYRYSKDKRILHVEDGRFIKANLIESKLTSKPEDSNMLFISSDFELILKVDGSLKGPYEFQTIKEVEHTYLELERKHAICVETLDGSSYVIFREYDNTINATDLTGLLKSKNEIRSKRKVSSSSEIRDAIKVIDTGLVIK